MKKQITIAELKKLVKAAMDKRQERINILSGNKNPQLIRALEYHKGTHDALEAVYQALHGIRYPLKGLAE